MPFRAEPPAPDRPLRDAPRCCGATSARPTNPRRRPCGPTSRTSSATRAWSKSPRLSGRSILHGIILRIRPAKSAAKYASIWMPEGSPLKVWTQQAGGAAGAAGSASAGIAVLVRDAHALRQPVDRTRSSTQLKAEGVTRVLVMQAYPQYSGTTTASVIDAVNDWTARGAPACPSSASSTSTTTTRTTSRRWRRASSAYWQEQRPPRPAGDELPWHSGAQHPRWAIRTRRNAWTPRGCWPQRLGLPDDAVPRDLPVALRPRQMAGALHRAHPARAGRARAWGGST